MTNFDRNCLNLVFTRMRNSIKTNQKWIVICGAEKSIPWSWTAISIFFFMPYNVPRHSCSGCSVCAVDHNQPNVCYALWQCVSFQLQCTLLGFRLVSISFEREKLHRTVYENQLCSKMIQHNSIYSETAHLSMCCIPIVCHQRGRKRSARINATYN